MAKFIKFNITLTGAVQPAAPISPILINVDDITTVTAAGAAGAQSSVVIGLKTGRNSYCRLHYINSSAFNISFSFSCSNFCRRTKKSFRNAVHSAMTANPGGVVTTCSLGNDQAAATAALPNGAQMFWGTAVFA